MEIGNYSGLFNILARNFLILSGNLANLSLDFKITEWQHCSGSGQTTSSHSILGFSASPELK